MTEWSEPEAPSPSCRAWSDRSSRRRRTSASAEPEPRSIIKSVDSINAAEIALDNWFTRGSVLNFAEGEDHLVDASTRSTPRNPEDSPDFKFLTGLDAGRPRGGDQLAPKNRNLDGLLRALVMDSSGRLN